ncbi:cytoplasmic protein [Cryptococcus neoformans C23]|uniref:Cytoplasmic protein n=2 Tax=Cryptococcus neoformans TaxID=5207 RepID=A0A854Q6K1_CRYNE|nr:cytoplasmic protein [Cryptococcus neoformans var. grubii H99]AUB28052.1 cytoplasmic protein [Cryptococcus neoformans var. grubii]OWZ27734.1 cytoplasmic protein [Cryptococcus neoformans var. grubii AD2-60a]OWZ31880.1 cytoplasmic protein [Cryptococcus neoformans var. grubii AD1-83a]OWZ40038.1 cytoplasmic protein [Cryptococcus neoformans var. grubii C23]OWZ51116.1 cytoplasmic protein [Cryptococcus neoformans var. grubii 125.91]OXC81919.1 cytoplasmic protein [Cryptococcus neoformans var. grubi|eukprot:XP_012052446.1 cytoplasmic protein [Cryptococcus neoformans var. grubii H99]
MPRSIPDHSIRISIDRGGTFTDVHASIPAANHSETREEFIFKLLSQDPSNYKDAPTEGIRRVLGKVTGQSIERGKPLPVDKLEYVRLSTTVATNALLERKGQKHALIITKGFKDLLEIGNQARPNIFDLNIKRAKPLYSRTIEVDERVTLVGFSSDPNYEKHSVMFNDDGSIRKPYSGVGADEQQVIIPGRIVRGLSGEAVNILREPNLEAIKVDLQNLYNDGYRSIAVCLAHSYTFPDHELAIGKIATEVGFPHISLSSQLLPMIKMTPRGQSTTADAYLTPILRDYLEGFYSGFEGGKDGSLHVEFMGSDGGLVDLKNFSGLKSILSGPAGGVVGCALTSWDKDEKIPIIGLDVGGTSTDVSRYAGHYESVYETTTAGISINTLQLDINTVAAGGGSCLTYKNGLFRAGPESAGAHPGPACYRKGGPLALTDGNLFLGRLIPKYFPRCFGPNEDQDLDPEASHKKFEQMAEVIRKESGTEKSLDEIVYGFVKVANETMARPIRTLTEARGFKTEKHILASFGGAGGQHACEIAELLGIQRVLIHKYSSILSAYGLALADRVFELQEPAAVIFSQENKAGLNVRLDKLERDVFKTLLDAGFADDKIGISRILNMRYDGSDTALMISNEGSGDYEKEFKRAYKEEFGFLLNKNIVVDDVKVRGVGKTFDSLGPSPTQEVRNLELSAVNPEHADCNQDCYVWYGKSGKREEVPVFKIESLSIGNTVIGPAMVIDETQTIFVNQGWKAISTSSHLLMVQEKKVD